MEIAFIVQCHKNSEQLNLLFKQLKQFDCDIYVHIDRKSIDIDNSIVQYDNLYIIPFEERVGVGWGDISQVDATLKLIDYVLKSRKKYDFVWLISGQDLPIKSTKNICCFLEQNKGNAFIDVQPTDTNRYKRFLKRNEVWNTAWLSKKGFVRRVIRNAWYFITGGRYKTLKLFKRKLDFNIFYFGSSWWCLPFDAVIQMSDYLKNNPQYHKFFKHCHCPDESFFQTLLMNHTAYANKVRPKLVYVDWRGCKNSPRILRQENYDEIVAESNNCLLARKFDMQVDSEIIKKIIKVLGND